MGRVLRRLARVVAWMTLSTVLLVLVAATTLILWARSRAGRQLLKATVVSRLQQQLNGSITIAALDGDLTRTCILRDVRVYDRERRLAAAFPKIELEYQLAGLLTRTIRVRSIRSDGEIAARRLPDGGVNLVELLRPRRRPAAGAAEPGSRWAVDIAAARGRIGIRADGFTDQTIRGRLTFAVGATIRGRTWDIQLRKLRGDLEAPARATVEAAGGVGGSGRLPVFRDVRIDVAMPAQAWSVASARAMLGPSALTVRANGHAATLLVDTPGGALHAEARADDAHWTASASTAGLDPGAVLAQAPHGRIDLAARASGAGRAASIAVDTFRFDVAGTRAYARGRVDLDGALRVDVEADVQSPDLARVARPFGVDLHGELAADVHAQQAPGGRAVAATVHARDLGLGRVRAGRLDAHVAMKGLAGRATLTLHDATLALTAAATARLRSLSVAVDGDGRALAAALDGVVADGSRLRVRAHAVPLAHDGAYALRIGELAVVGPTERWSLTEPAELRVGRNVVAARLSLAAGTRALRVDGAIRSAPWQIDVRVHARRLALDALASAVLVGHSLPSAELDADAELHGRLTAPRFDAHVAARTAPWPRYELPGMTVALDADGDEQRLAARLQAAADGEQLRARFETTLQADGPRAVAGELEIHGLRLAHLRRLVPPSLHSSSGRASLTAHLAGTVADPELAAHATVSRWHLDQGVEHDTALDVSYRHARVDASVESHAVAPGRGWLSLRAHVPVALTSAPALRVHVPTAEPLVVTLRGRDLPIGALAVRALALPAAIRSGAADVSLDLRGTVAAPAAAVHVDVHELAVADVADGALRLDGTLRHGRADAVLHAAVHGAPLAVARVEATLDPLRLADRRTRATTPLSLVATVEAYDLGRLPRFAGTAEARAELVGTLAAPRVSGLLHARDLGAFGMTFATVDADATWDGGALAATVHATQPAGGSLQLAARLPPRPDEALEAHLQLHQLQLTVERAGRLRQLHGTANADLRVNGTRRAPSGHGFFTLAHGAVAFGATSRPYHDVAVDVRLDHRTLAVRRLDLAANGGTLAAHGELTLDDELRPVAVDLVADASRFPFQPGNAAAWLDAHVQLHGRGSGDRFDGELAISRGRARLPSREAGRTLQPTRPLEDVVFVDDATGAPSSTAEALKQRAEALDVTVLARIPGPFRVESSELRAELRGELELRAVGGAVRLYGEAETTSGRFELLSRPYEIERARVSFHGDLDPRIDVRLTRDITDAKVIIEVHGTANAPVLELTSDPPIYDQSQLIGVLIAGDPEHQRIADRSTEQQVVGAISDVLIGRVLDQIAPGLPIDVIRVDTRASASNFAGFENARLEVGKYIRDDIYVSYVHRFGATLENTHGANRHEANVEYRFRRRFALGMRYGDAGIGSLDLSWSLRF